MSGETLRVSRLEEGGVLDVEIAAGKGNVLSMAVMSELGRVLDAHRDEAGLKLVLLRGSPKVFSFGASVEEHVASKAPGMLAAFHALIRNVGGYPVPIAALVAGPCLGGAFELVLGCHFVLATPSASFACPEIKLGVLPPVLAAIGPHRLGAALSERLLLTGATLGSDEAERAGWLTKRIVTEDALAEALGWYRETLAPLSAYSLRQAVAAARAAGGMHACLGAGIDEAERLYLEKLVPSHDGNEGITAFIERRKPVWKDA
jgi:cyclohexa-1,5-dienecarbonyl-CoA hydratase